MMHLFTFTFADTEDDVREESEEESPTVISNRSFSKVERTSES